jgi:hypothetical protein
VKYRFKMHTFTLFGDAIVICNCDNCTDLTKSPKVIYNIRPVTTKAASVVIVKYHYLHRNTSISQAFGLFCNKTGFWVGVITYGTPSSAPLRSGICGKDEKINVMELNRLWIRDDTPKNTESFLIGNTVKMVNKEIIVSFADTSHGHIGTVYQATNWIYTGLSAKRTDWTIEGVERHGQTLADKYTASEIRAKFGDKFKLVDRARKHRYIFFNCSKKRKKELIEKLMYKIKSFPKITQQTEQ